MDKEGTSGSGTGKMDHSGDFYSVVRTISFLVQWSEGPYIPLNCAIERAIAKQGINLIAKYKSQWLPESFDPETYLCFSFVFCCRIEIPGLATTSPIARLRVGSGGGEMGAISAGVGATQERPNTLQPHGHSPHHTFSPTTRASPTQVSELNKLRFWHLKKRERSCYTMWERFRARASVAALFRRLLISQLIYIASQ